MIFGAATASFVLVGLLLVVRAPGNRSVPSSSPQGRSWRSATAATSTVRRERGKSCLAAAVIASVLGGAIFVVPIALALVGIPLIFPDGHLISPRWRLLVSLAVVALAAGVTGSLLGPTTATEGVPNPLAVPGSRGCPKPSAGSRQSRR